MTNRGKCGEEVWIGYRLENGVWTNRQRMPNNFWRKHEWGEYPPIQEVNVHYDCMKTKALVDFLNESFENFHVSNKTVKQWFVSDKVSEYKLQGVYRRCHNNADELYIHREFAIKIKNAIATDPEIVFEIPIREKPVKKDVQQVLIKPVPEESIVLQRLGGLQGNYVQGFKRVNNRIDTIETIVEELKQLIHKNFSATNARVDELDKNVTARVEEVNKNVTLQSSWLRANFPNEWKEVSE